MSGAGAKTVKVLVADDNPLVRDLIIKGMEPYCEVNGFRRRGCSAEGHRHPTRRDPLRLQNARSGWAAAL